MTDATIVARTYEITLTGPDGSSKVRIRYAAPGYLTVTAAGAHVWHGSDEVERAPRWLRDLITEHAPEWWEAGNG